LNCYGGSKAKCRAEGEGQRAARESGDRNEREKREREKERERWIERKGEARGTGKYVSNAVETFY